MFVHRERIETMTREKRLRTFHLRGKHEVFEADCGYTVVHTGGNGEKYLDEVSPGVADFLFAECAGTSVTRIQAARKLRQAAHRLEMPYTYGYKLGFYAQAVLLVLAATDRATFEKDGRRYRYWIGTVPCVD